MTHTLRGFLRLTVCCMLGAMTLSGSLAAAGDAPRTPEDVQARMQELRRQYAPYLQSLPKPADPRQRTLLENGWRTKFEIEKATSSERPEPPEWFREDFDDSAWEPATVPEFRYAAAAYRQPQSSILWYRTRFSAGATPPGQRTFIVFAGVDWEAEVWLNGQSLGRHKVYYEPFRFDVTKLLKEKNVLAVRVFGGPRFGEPIAYWTVLPDPVADIQRYVRDPAKSIIGYKTDAQHLGAGFGIHREVFLETAGETIVSEIFVRGDPAASEAKVAVELDSAAAKDLAAEVQILPENFSGDSFTKSVPHRAVKGPGKLTLSVAMPGAKLWTPEEPRLYRCRVTLRDGGRTVDVKDALFGVRSFEMVSKKNPHAGLPDGMFLLNGKPLFLRGTNVSPALNAFWYWHQDDKLMDALLMIKAADFNSIRVCQHVNFPEVRELLDRLGIMSEQDQGGGRNGNSPAAIGELAYAGTVLARTCYNHPGVVLLSLTNETKLDPTLMVEAVLAADPERIVVPISGNFTSDKAGYRFRDELWASVVDDYHWYYGWYGYIGEIWRLSEKLAPGRLITMGEYGAEGLDAYETMSQHAPPHFPKTPPATEDTLWWQVQVEKVDAKQLIGSRGKRPGNLGQYIEASQNYQADLLAERTKGFRLSPQRVSGYFQFHFIDATAAHWPKSIVSYDFRPKKGYYEMAQVNQPVVPLFQLIDRGKAMEVWVANDRDAELRGCRVQWNIRWGDEGLQGSRWRADIAPLKATMLAKVDLSSIPETADTVKISMLLSDSAGKAISRYEREIYLKAWRVEKEALVTDGEFRKAILAPSQKLPPVRALTHGPKFHWFGYYDKLQFDPAQRYVLSNEVDFEGRTPKADDAINIGMIDLEDHDKWIELGQSRAWCWQQGCMLQWRPGSKSEILWNDRQGDRYVCHVLDVKTGKKRTLPRPIHTLSPDGKWALTVDPVRTQQMRPGYGYPGIDPNAEVPAPENSGIGRMNLETGQWTMLVPLAKLAKIPAPDFDAAARGKIYADHVQYSPDGKRFLFLCRDGLPGWDKATRMFTAAADGSDLRLVNLGSSHYVWRDNAHILIWVGGFKLFKDDGSLRSETLWEASNGHQSYLPGNEWIVCDTYPLGKERLQHLYLYHVPTREFVPLGHFGSPAGYEGEWRCDTHPRLSPDGSKVVFDSPHGGNGRQLYLIDIGDIVKKPK